MRLLITTRKNLNLPGYTIKSTMEGINWEDVAVLIYHSSTSKEVDIVMGLTQAGEHVEKKIYINDDISPILYGVFGGLGGDIYSDETYLQGGDTLDYIVDYYGSTGVNLKLPIGEVEKINNFIETLTDENVAEVEGSIREEIVVKTLQASVDTIETALAVSNEANREMVSLFTVTTNMLSNITKEHDLVTKEIQELSKSISEVRSRSGSKGTNKTIFYPVHRIPDKTKKVMYVRVYSPCMYLTTYLAHYVHYLKMQKGVNAKVLLVVPALKLMIQKYSKLPRIAPETIRTMDYEKGGDVYVTHEPMGAVLDSYLNTNLDLHIVVDMMYGDKMLKGKPGQVIEFSAFSVITDAYKFGVSTDSTKVIVPYAGLAPNIRIPYMQSYTKQRSAGNTTGQRTAYFEEMQNFFKLTTADLGIK